MFSSYCMKGEDIKTLLLEEIEECIYFSRDRRFTEKERFYYLTEVNRLTKVLEEVTVC